jgi:hypothetical protein
MESLEGTMKRRILLSVGVLTLLSATAGAGGIDARSAAGPPSDFVLASFDDQYATHYFLNAWSGPAGEKSRGRLVTSISWLKANVDCLAVHRHEALVIGDNRKGYFVVTLLLRDNEPGPDELLSIEVRQGTSPRRCPPFDGTDGWPGTPVSGEINVHDAREP